MKKLNILILMISLFLPGLVLGEGKPFSITGKMAGQWEGRVYLVSQNEEHLDTLRKGNVAGGKFRIEGRINSSYVAVLAFAPQDKKGFFLLEPGFDYEVQEGKDGQLRIEGGRSQEYLNHYLGIAGKAKKKTEPLSVKMKAASREMHMKTVAELKKEIDGISAAAREEMEQYVSENRNTLFAAFVLINGVEQMKLDALEQCYERLTGQERLLAPGQRVAYRIAGLKNTEVKAIAPDFILLTPEGEEVSLYEVKGKLKIIDFWASWCGPCRLENPTMVQLYQDFKERGLAIVSVSLDTDKKKWVEAIRKDGMPWIHVSSLEGWNSKVVKTYGVDAVPAIFVLDGNNRILAKQLRGTELREFVSQHLE